jgi:hypothetical protein
VLQDKENIAVIDAKTMKVTAHYGFAGKGARWNGLVLDAKNHVLFAACGQSGNPPEPKPAMVILDAGDAKILTTLPLAGSSGGAVFNPKTMEAFSTHARRQVPDARHQDRSHPHDGGGIRPRPDPHAGCAARPRRTRRTRSDAGGFVHDSGDRE